MMGKVRAAQQGWLAARFDEQVKRGAPWLGPHRRAQFLELYKKWQVCLLFYGLIGELS
jgi:hypothetical protein